MSKACHQIVVDARKLVHGLCDLMNQLQGVVRKDIPRFNGDPNDDDIRATESVFNFVMELNIGVRLGEQVGKVRVHSDTRDLCQAENRDDANES